MATLLAAQLAQVAARSAPQEPHVRGKASLLYDYQKAADVSVESLLGIAQTGLAALVKADKRFAPFADSLFSADSLRLSRESLTAAENAALDANIAAFLRVLTNHFLAPPAFQVLEYAIRRYKVHVCNVHELLLCALPYHATPEFARLVVLMQLAGTPWAWLSPGQSSGAPPPRDVIVRRCVNDQAVLRAVCGGAQALGGSGFVSKTFLSFYAVLLCEVLAAAPRMAEDLLTLLLPFLAAGLKHDASREYRSATLMVLTQLLARAQLSADFLAVVAVEVAASWAELGGATVLMMLAHMAASQPHLTTLPPKALDVIAEHADAAGELAELQRRKAHLSPLLALLLSSTTAQLPHTPGLASLMRDLLTSVTLDPALVQASAQQLLVAGAAAVAAADSGAADSPEVLQRVLRVFDLHYPDQLDAAINTALQAAAAAAGDGDAAAAAAAAQDDAASKKKKKKQGSKVQQHGSSSATEALFQFVQQCFTGSRHEVLPAAAAGDDGAAAAQQQQQALTLALAVNAPASEMRLLALQKLDAICSTAAAVSVSSSMQQLLQTSLLGGLRDDVFAVAAAAAAADGLTHVPAEQQLPALAHLLQRAAAAVAVGHVAAAADGASEHDASSSKASGAKEALRAARAGLVAVAALGERVAGEDALAVQQQAAALLLEFAVSDKRSKKLAKAAVRAALQCSWSPLLQALAAAPAVAAALEGGDAAAPAAGDGKRGKQKAGGKKAGGKKAHGDDAAEGHVPALVLNRAVVGALAEAAAADDRVLHAVAVLLPSCGARCRHLLLLVLTKAAAVAAASPEAAAAAAAATPAKSKARSSSRAGKGARAHGSSSGSGHTPAAASAAHIAAVLVGALEQHMAAASGGKQGSGGAALPNSWSDDAQQVLDDASQLPTKQHMIQLASQPLQQLNGVVLLAGLHAALTAASAASLAAELGQPVQLFARLAGAAQAAGSAQDSGLLDHVRLLVLKCGETPEQQLAFLSRIYGLPTDGVAGEAAQAVALQLLPAAAAAAASAAADSAAWFARLLAAAGSSSKAVRAAAVDALLALPTAVSGSSGWQLPGGFAAQHLQELVEALQPQVVLLKGSPSALAQLVSAALAAGPHGMDTDLPSPKSRKKARVASGGRGKAGGSAHDDAADHASVALQLPGGCAVALQQLLLAALSQQQQEEADLLAARLVVSTLQAAAACGSASTDAATLAAAAQQLLLQLTAAVCQHASQNTGSAGHTPVWEQLVASSSQSPAAAASALQALRTDVAASLLRFFTPAALAQDAAVAGALVQLVQLPFNATAAAAVVAAARATEEGSSQTETTQQSQALAPAQLAAMAPIRAAALAALSAEAFGSLQQHQQQAAFTAALQTLASDGDDGCRTAARHCLEQLPVTAAMLLALLQAVVSSSGGGDGGAAHGTPQSKAKRARRAASDASGGAVQEAQPGAGQGELAAGVLDAAIAALEFLQWRDDVEGRQQLVQPLQQLLRVVIPFMGSIAESHAEEEADEDGDASTAADAAAAGGSNGCVSPSAAGYAAQLSLLVLEQLAREQLAAKQQATSSSKAKAPAAGAGIDADLVLSCASAAPDGAVRNAALLLMAVLAQLSPQDVLDHVLKAMSVIHHSAAFQGDAHSSAVAASTLAALVPAWLSAGRGSQQLWSNLLAALPLLPGHRRLGLLEALLTALPQDQGLSVGLLLMMQQLVEHTSSKKAAAAAAGAATSPAAAAAASPGGGKKGKMGKKAAAAEAGAAAEPASAPEDGLDAWLPELMASLCEKVDALQRLQAFADLLTASLAGADGHLGAAHAHLPRLAVSFVATNLRAKSVTSAIAAARSAAQAGASSDQVGLQHSCKDIMAQGLLHLLQLNPSADGAAAAAAAAKAATSGRRLQRAISAAADGVYDLLAALESVQDCSSYLLSLVEMSKQASDSVQRRALKLLATRLQKCAVDIADLETAESAAGLSPAERAAAERELVEAGLAICPQLARLLQPSTPAITQQLALVAADAGIRQFGAHMPPVVLGSLMDVLQVVAQSGAPPAVRASALACIAAGVTALGHQLVPLLPQTAETVLGAAEAAVQGLAAAEQAGSDSSSDEEEGQATERDTSRAAEECALQLAGAVAALEALVTGLGAFMSPYIKRILQLLLSRQVLSCSVANANAAAGRLRGSLPAKIPARLLIEPLVSQWEHVLAACGKDGGESGPAVGLLDLVAGLASSLEPSVAVAYHEQLAGLLLQALDTRSRWLASSSGDGQQQQQLRTAAAAAGVDGSTAAAAAAAAAAFGAQEVHAIEAGAVRALSALVMKLSESKFKPLFLRMLDWTSAEAGAAGSGSSAGSEQQGIGRVAALFAAVVALGHRLRGVFAPYHKYFAMQLMKQLAGEGLGGGGGKRSKKKRKLSAAAADGSSGSSEHAQMSAWLARLRAVRAVHLLALHEAPGATPAAQQEAQERTGRMVPLLVEVLQEGPPPACAALLAEQGSDPALDVAGGPVAALGPVGKAVVEAGAGAVLESAVDVVGAAAVGALLAVAVAGGSDVVWKPLHHALLMSTRGGSVRAKLLALGAVSRLVAELREEYLMLLPEALPFIAELVEEGEVAVEAAAQGLIAQMEALSGERLEQYLKA